MSQDWYRRNAAPQRPKGAVVPPPTKFVIGADGRAYALAEDGAPPEGSSGAQQYPVNQPVQPWNRPAGPNDPPIGQTRLEDGLRYWKGSRDTVNAGNCPNCGSPNYFATLRADSDTGGESGKLSAGHCPACGYRDLDRSDGLRGPTLQTSTRGIRAMGSGEIPVEQARSVPNGNRDSMGRQSGGFAIFAHS